MTSQDEPRFQHPLVLHRSEELLRRKRDGYTEPRDGCFVEKRAVRIIWTFPLPALNGVNCAAGPQRPRSGLLEKGEARMSSEEAQWLCEPFEPPTDKQAIVTTAHILTLPQEVRTIVT